MDGAHSVRVPICALNANAAAAIADSAWQRLTAPATDTLGVSECALTIGAAVCEAQRLLADGAIASVALPMRCWRIHLRDDDGVVGITGGVP
ncbi:MAG: hypothetical protein K2R93_14510 [Gemmatimonadaceae bacterium]|nr:hypothetical protein [Gemmatimonadaceae bacterium]